MSVVGVDPSLTSCGIAVLDRDIRDKPFPAHVTSLRAVGHAGENGASYADRSDRIVSQTRLVLGYIPRDAELVVMEGPAYGQHMPSTHDRSALWWGIYSNLRSRGTPIAVCAPSTRAKWATGYGNATKAVVVSHVRQQWPDRLGPRDHDEADALTLAGMGALHLGWTLPFPIKDRHHTGIEAVAWPKEMTDA